jgi:hypothetical protein
MINPEKGLELDGRPDAYYPQPPARPAIQLEQDYQQGHFREWS